MVGSFREKMELVKVGECMVVGEDLAVRVFG